MSVNPASNVSSSHISLEVSIVARGIVSLRRVGFSAALLLGGFVLGITSPFGGHHGAAHVHAQDAQQAKAAHYWNQLTQLMKPVEMPTMTDHRAFMLPSGVVIALHFDNMSLDQAENLNWVALGIPGTFCAADQLRVEAAYGPGFTHFHDMVNDIHGGAPGAQGVWFVHTAVRDFQSMMSGGPVAQGVDMKFMPTPGPTC